MSQTSGLTLSLIKPIKDFGYVFKSGPAIEYNVKLDEDEHVINFSYNIGLYYLVTRQDTFKSLYYLNEDNVNFTTSYEVIKYYFVFPAGISAEYTPQKKKWNPILGLDLYCYTAFYYHYYHVPGIIEEDELFAKSIQIGLVPRAGLGYDLGKGWKVSTGIGKSFAIDLPSLNFKEYWKPFISINHTVFD